MPWEKTFDEDEAIDKAMHVFWEKGFEPASMADLIAGIGITRGSLYNAFGGKEQLFVKALKKYDRDYRRALLAEMEALDDPKRAIAALFDGARIYLVVNVGQYSIGNRNAWWRGGSHRARRTARD
jgi:TetR/AcrR family transcriptional repressor of nem operon